MTRGRDRMGRFTCMAVFLSIGLCTSALSQSSGRWMTGAPMPSERSEVAVAAVEGRIYVVGGFAGQTELEIYDPTADRWTRGSPFPHAVHHAAAVGLDGKLWVIGGYMDGWSTHAPMPTARHGLGAVAVGARIYVVAGGPTPGGSASSRNEVFTP